MQEIKHARFFIRKDAKKNDLLYVPRWDLDFKIGGNIFGGVFLDAHSVV